MAWDSTKSAGDIIYSSEYNTHVTDQKARGIPQSEDVLGSSCTGTDGNANRTLTLAQSTIKSSGIILTVNGATLHNGATKDYTVSSNVITFLNKVWDTDNIRIVYFT